MNYSTITNRVNVITNNIEQNDTENAIYNVISFLLYPDNKDRESLSQYIDEIIEENKLLVDFYNKSGTWDKMFGPNFTSDKIIGTTQFKDTMLNLLQANIVLKRKSKGISEEYAEITLGDLDVIKTQPETTSTTNTTTTTTVNANTSAPKPTSQDVNPIDYNFKTSRSRNEILRNNLELRRIVEQNNLERLDEEIKILTELQAYKKALKAHNQSGGHSSNKNKYIISNKKLFQLGGTWQQDLETSIKAKYSDYTLEDINNVIEKKIIDHKTMHNDIEQLDAQIKNAYNKTGGGDLTKSSFYEQLDLLLTKMTKIAIPLTQSISSEQKKEINQIIMDIQTAASVELNINMDNLLNELKSRYENLFNLEDAVKQTNLSNKLDITNELVSNKQVYTRLADNIIDTIGKIKARARNISMPPSIQKISEKIPLPMIDTSGSKYNKKYIVIKSNKL
jgi:hypothetical protein